MSRWPQATAALTTLDTASPAVRGATLADQLKPFLGWFYAVRGRGPNTISAYQRDLQAFIAFAQRTGVTLPSQVTFNLLEMYFAHRQHHEGRKANTINRARHALGAYFKFLRRQGLCTHDPVADTYALPKPQRVPKFLTIAEQEHVLAVFASRTSLVGRRDY